MRLQKGRRQLLQLHLVRAQRPLELWHRAHKGVRVVARDAEELRWAVGDDRVFAPRHLPQKGWPAFSGFAVCSQQAFEEVGTRIEQPSWTQNNSFSNMLLPEGFTLL